MLCIGKKEEGHWNPVAFTCRTKPLRVSLKTLYAAPPGIQTVGDLPSLVARLAFVTLQAI